LACSKRCSRRRSAAEVLAVVLVYRAIYYLLPLVFALPAYGLSEAAARRQRPDGPQAVGEAPG
jgi:hypothetical protein